MTLHSPLPARPNTSGGRRALALALATAVAATALVATGVATQAADAHAATTAPAPTAAAKAFTPGDVVVYRVGDGSAALSSAATAAFLDEYTPTGTLVQSIALPTKASGSNNAFTASGSSGSDGLLTLSADGRYLVAPGYAAAVGTKKVTGTASASTPRTVARIAADGTVDTSTALTDTADGNNFRSVASTDGTDLWVGGAAGGPRYTTLGSTTSTELDSGTFKNVRQVSVVGGQLYASADPSKAGLTIGTVGSGTPKAAVQPVTNLPFDKAPGDPYAYSLLTLGDGTAPDTLYEADSTAGTVVKYALVDGVWSQLGSVLVPGITGLTANDVDGKGDVAIMATSAGPDSTTGTLFSIADDSGFGGTLAGIATPIATAPANEAIRGVAFAPGTVIGSGGGIKPPVVKPTIATADTALPAALGDAANETLAVTVGDTAADPSDLTVTATSSNQAVATDAGISVTGSGTTRTLHVTPAATGTATITLTVTAPDGTTAATQIAYGVSADLSSAASKVSYLTGAANASASVNAGDGYAFFGDDESNTIRLYDLTKTGTPAATFDFDSLLPFGSTEVDIEGAAKRGDVIYWEGSMSTSSSGKLAPSRSTVFATRVTGSGASATLTYLGSYTGLLADLVSWDDANGSGLGAGALGLAASSSAGVDGHSNAALNLEGLEFASPTSGTAYLSFRAPLEPTTDRHLAMLVPVTNYADLSTSGNQTSSHATFGAPIFFDLGGLAVRDIKENSKGQFLIVAGTADETNSRFELWSWDGVVGHAPRKTGTTLPAVPTADDAGSWETIVGVPDDLGTGSQVQLVQDDGDVDWYGDGLTSKTGLAQGLQKSVALTFDYAAPAPLATSLTVTPSASRIAPHTAVTLSAAVSGPADQASPAGTVAFTVRGADGSSVACPTATVSATGVATCVLPAGALKASGTTYTVTASFAGSPDFAASTATTQVTVVGTATSTAAVSATLFPTTKSANTVLGTVLPRALIGKPLAAPVTVTATNPAGTVLWSKTTTLPLLPIVLATVPGSTLPVGTSTITVAYAGTEYYAPSSASITMRLTR